MNKKVFVAATLFIFFAFALFSNVLAWDDKVTHKDLSEYGAESSVLSKDKGDYLKNLGFDNDLDEYLRWGSDNEKIRYWLREGAELEDAGTKWEAFTGVARFNNHFHNPLKAWTEAGLDDWVLVLHYTGESSVIWAQDFDRQQNAVGGNWSWQRIRQSYYDALTAQSEDFKQASFAVTFSGLGRQMHLIEDMGQPDHVRNDAHPEDAMFGSSPVNGSVYFETWTAKKFPDLVKLKEFFIENGLNIVFPNVLFNISYAGLTPITQFVDTDQYDGLNASAEINQGLAEYVNANFFSGDTIFAAERYSTDHRHYSPFPKKTSTDLASYIAGTKPVETFIDDDGSVETGTWISKNADGEWIDHLAKTSLLTRTVYNFTGEGTLFYSTFYLDEKCHEDYASKLIPRAVGYSAGLLNYFFRGTLEITPPEQVAYAVTDGSITPYVDANGNYHQQFKSIKAKIRNSTPDTLQGEEIQDGIIQAVAKYKIIPNYMYNLSNYPPDGNVMKDMGYSYSVSLPVTITSLSSSDPIEFTFNFTDNPIPAGITDLYLQVIFKGTLGNEADIAVAIGMKDLMEPTHQVFWNATDMFQLDGHLYTSDEIKNSPALAAQVDNDHDGVFNEPGEQYIDPHPVTFGIGYPSQPPGPVNPFTYSAITTVQSGEHIRVIALLDKPQNNYVALEKNDNIEAEPQYFFFSSAGVMNQDENGVWQTPTPITTFRYGLDIDGITQIPIRQHFRKAYFRCYPMEGSDPDGNPVCYYSESEVIPGELMPSQIDTIYFP